jgi:glycerol-3-phosphate dehydrogenase
MLAPLRFFGLTRKLGGKGVLAVKAGLMVYDRFGNRHRTMPKHSTYSRGQALKIVPQLSPNIRMVAQYHDALISQPERLVLEMIEDAERDCLDAMALPYLSASGMDGDTISLRDEISGATYQVKPRLVINTAGPWADEVSQGLGFNDTMVGGTKGSHIVVRNKALADALDGRMLYFEADDFRACIVLSLSGDRLFLGATDIRSDDPEDRRCSDEEIDYIFGVMAAVLPGVQFSRDDIVYTVAGVRPLPRTDVADPGLISRDHTLHQFLATEARPFPVFTLIGGKWTTYRACAEQIADAVLGHLGLERNASTRELPIGGGQGFPRDPRRQEAWAGALAQRLDIREGRARDLAWRYGSRSAAVAEAERRAPGDLIAGFSEAEIGWIVRNERVTRLEDIVQRRTLLAFEGRVTRAVLSRIAEIAAPILGWDADRTESESDATGDLLTTRHRMTLEAA